MLDAEKLAALFSDDQISFMTGAEIDDVFAEAGYDPAEITAEVWSAACDLIMKRRRQKDEQA